MGLEKEQHEGFVVFIFNSLPTLDVISFMRMLISPFILNDIVPRIKISSIVYLLISHCGNHCRRIVVLLPGNLLSYSY